MKRYIDQIPLSVRNSFCTSKHFIDIEDVLDRVLQLILSKLDINNLQIYEYHNSSQTFRLKLYLDNDYHIPKDYFDTRRNQLEKAILSRDIIEDPSTNRVAFFLTIHRIPLFFIRLKLSTSLDKKQRFKLKRVIEATERTLEDSIGILDLLYLYREKNSYLTLYNFARHLEKLREREYLLSTKYTYLQIPLLRETFKRYHLQILSILRTTDYVTYNFNSNELLLLLPSTSKKRGPILKERIDLLFKQLKNIN